MSLENLLYEFDEKVQNYISKNFERVKARDLGLDDRSAHEIFVSREGIMVCRNNDRSLQYYGGFEYIDVDCRREYGSEYVFYSAEDNRVRGHLNHIYEDIQEYED